MRIRIPAEVLAVLLAAATMPIGACAEKSQAPAAPTNPGGSVPGLSGTLQSGCFGWPAVDFSPSNKASVTAILRTGQPAVDFTLKDPAGVSVRLSDLLRTKPVLLVHGAFT